MRGRRLDGARAGAFQGLREAGDADSKSLLEGQLTRQKHHDSLTGLANRTLFLQHVAQQLTARNQGGFAVLVIGLDDFKSVNDSLGHTAADDLLKAVALNLRGKVSATDALGRLPGAELAVLLVGITSPAEARQLAESLQGLLRSPATCAGVEITARVSIGVRHCAGGADIDVGVNLRLRAQSNSSKRQTRRCMSRRPPAKIRPWTL